MTYARHKEAKKVYMETFHPKWKEEINEAQLALSTKEGFRTTRNQDPAYTVPEKDFRVENEDEEDTAAREGIKTSRNGSLERLFMRSQSLV